MLSTNQIMTVVGVMFIVAASLIWLAPRPARTVEPGAGGH
jgi:DHA2 family multidrug resistance protein